MGMSFRGALNATLFARSAAQNWLFAKDESGAKGKKAIGIHKKVDGSARSILLQHAQVRA